MPEPYAVMREKIKNRLRAKTDDQRLRELKQRLSELSPIYKELRVELKQQLKALERKKSSRARTSHRKHPSVRKMSPQAVIISYQGSNPRLLFQTLSGRKSGFSEEILLGSFLHNDVPIQLVLTPVMDEDTTSYNRELMSVIRATDGLLLYVKDESDFQELISELQKANINTHNYARRDRLEGVKEKTSLPSVVVYESEKPTEDLVAVKANDSRKIRDEIYKCLGITRIYLTKTNKEGFSRPPLIFLQDSVVVGDVLGKIARAAKSKFKYARVWGSSAKFDGEMLGLKRKLADGDIVRIYGI